MFKNVLYFIVIALLTTSCQQESKTVKENTKSTPATTSTAKKEMPASSAKKGEWVVLFDGVSGGHWRAYGEEAFPSEGWTVTNGALTLLAKSGGGDLITREKYENFDFELEFKIPKAANSGILYLVQELEGKPIYLSAPEYQIIDDANYLKIAEGDASVTKHHLTADNYDLQTATNKQLNPVGQWNKARIVINNGHVEHYLNGAKVVEYDLWSPAWKEMVAGSKFADWEAYGQAKAGHIGLQDHGDGISFRNIRIKRL